MAKQRYRKPRAVKIGDGPTKERWQHNGGFISEIIDRDINDTVLVRRFRAVWECPLDAYKDNGLISSLQHKAGLRFRQAYFSSVLSRGAHNERINPRPTSTGLTMSEKIVRQAHDVVSPHNMGVVVAVCGHDQHIWNPAALEKLRKGLSHLAVEWNMAAIEVCDRKKR